MGLCHGAGNGCGGATPFCPGGYNSNDVDVCTYEDIQWGSEMQGPRRWGVQFQWDHHPLAQGDTEEVIPPASARSQPSVTPSPSPTPTPPPPVAAAETTAFSSCSALTMPVNNFETCRNWVRADHIICDRSDNELPMKGWKIFTTGYTRLVLMLSVLLFAVLSLFGIVVPAVHAAMMTTTTTTTTTWTTTTTHSSTTSSTTGTSTTVTSTRTSTTSTSTTGTSTTRTYTTHTWTTVSSPDTTVVATKRAHGAGERRSVRTTSFGLPPPPSQPAPPRTTGWQDSAPPQPPQPPPHTTSSSSPPHAASEQDRIFVKSGTTPAPPLPKDLHVTMHVKNLDYESLSKSEKVLGVFKRTLQVAIAYEVGGVSPQGVFLALSAGSVKVSATVPSLPPDAADRAAQAIQGNEAFRQKVQKSIGFVRGIAASSTGPIDVSEVSTSSEESDWLAAWLAAHLHGGRETEAFVAWNWRLILAATGAFSAAMGLFMLLLAACCSRCCCPRKPAHDMSPVRALPVDSCLPLQPDNEAPDEKPSTPPDSVEFMVSADPNNGVQRSPRTSAILRNNSRGDLDSSRATSSSYPGSARNNLELGPRDFQPVAATPRQKGKGTPRQGKGGAPVKGKGGRPPRNEPPSPRVGGPSNSRQLRRVVNPAGQGAPPDEEDPNRAGVPRIRNMPATGSYVPPSTQSPVSVGESTVSAGTARGEYTRGASGNDMLGREYTTDELAMEPIEGMQMQGKGVGPTSSGGSKGKGWRGPPAGKGGPYGGAQYGGAYGADGKGRGYGGVVYPEGGGGADF